MRRVNSSTTVAAQQKRQQLLFALLGGANATVNSNSTNPAAAARRHFGLYGTPAPAPKPDPNLKLGATGTVKAPPSPFYKPASVLAAQGLSTAGTDGMPSIGAAPLQRAAPMEGTIVVWSAVDRKGIIEVKGGAGANGKTRWYRILSPRAFETLVPPHIKDLKGARVTHFVPIEATDGSHEPVRVYNRLVRPQFVQPTPFVAHKDTLAKADRQMKRRAHTINVAASVDRLEALALDDVLGGTTTSASAASSSSSSAIDGDNEKARLVEEMKAVGYKAKARNTHGGAAEEDEGCYDEEGADGDDDVLTFDAYGRPHNVDSLDIATNIIVDLSTAVAAKGTDLTGLKSRDYFEGGMRPATHSGVKDLRNKALFTKEELSMVAARREIADAKRASAAAAAAETNTTSTPLTAAEEEAQVVALAAEKLKAMEEEEADINAYKVEQNDMSTLGIKKLDRNRVKFSFGGGASTQQQTVDASSSTDPSKAAAEAAGFDEMLQSMRERMTASTSTSAAAAAAALSSNNANTIIRTVHSTKVVGKVIAWSQLHRTGLIVRYDESKTEEENKAVEEALDSDLADGFVIRNVDAFASAMPTAAALNGRKVSFTVVTYSDVKKGQTRFAEQITILGEAIDYRFDDPELRKAAKDKAREEQRLRRAHKNFVMEEVKRPAEAPKGHLFGVITRWSGGQGAIEASSGAVYYINNPKVFTDVVDSTHTSNVRGAVVRFSVDPKSPEYASTVEMISTPSSGSGSSGGSSLAFGGGAKTVGDLTPGSNGNPVNIRTVMASELGVGDGEDDVTSAILNSTPTPATLLARKKLQAASKSKAETDGAAAAEGSEGGNGDEKKPVVLVDGVDPRFTVMHSGDLAADDPRWHYGFLVTYSEMEGQAIIQALSKKFEHLELTDERGIRRLRPHQLGDRYLLKEFNTNVVNYEGANRVMIRKGRKVKFIPFGSSGRMATLVTPTDLELSEEEVKALESSEKAHDAEMGRELSASEEAIPGPTSGMYWMGRLEQAGFDMSEMREMKGHGTDGAVDPRAQAAKRAATMGLDEEDLKGDEFDPVALVENDPWYKDKSKNIKIPGSDMRIGDMQKLSPATMMGLATKVKDPASLQKTKDKYYNKLTEPQKEWAWNQAKAQAPAYERRIKDAHLKGEEPKFTFF